jgi:hypothetical protein
MATKKTPTKQRLQLAIDTDLYDFYEAKGRLSFRNAEDEILTRLATCREHTSPTALYLDDKTRQELEAIAGRQLKSARDVVQWARSIATFSVAGVNVPLSEQLMKRLDSRRFGKSMPEYVSRTTVDLLEKEVGMR